MSAMKRKFVWVICVLLAVIVILIVSFWAYQCRHVEKTEFSEVHFSKGGKAGWVEFVLYDQDGIPISGAEIELLNSSGSLSAESDPMGRVEIQNSETEISSISVDRVRVLDRPFATFLCCPSTSEGLVVTILIQRSKLK
jgi:Zn-dependent membrane protease YugP